MEFRPRSKGEALIEIKLICKEMLCIGVGTLLLGLLGHTLFYYKGIYLIHPIFNIVILLIGLSTIITSLLLRRKAIKNFKHINTKKKYWMTKTEAYIALKSGQKVTHEYFGSSEYLCMEYDIIHTEEGYNFDDEWDKRKGPEWSKGWRIYGAS